MTPAELAERCAEVINSPYGLKKVLLVVPGQVPRGFRVRLDRTSRKKCPMGEAVNFVEGRGVVAYFDAMDVLAWLTANGLVDVQAARAEE